VVDLSFFGCDTREVSCKDRDGGKESFLVLVFHAVNVFDALFDDWKRHSGFH
jgi:hypothetical protein